MKFFFKSILTLTLLIGALPAFGFTPARWDSMLVCGKNLQSADKQSVIYSCKHVYQLKHYSCSEFVPVLNILIERLIADNQITQAKIIKVDTINNKLTVECIDTQWPIIENIVKNYDQPAELRDWDAEQASIIQLSPQELALTNLRSTCN